MGKLRKQTKYSVLIYKKLGLVTLSGREWKAEPVLLPVFHEQSAMERSVIAYYHAYNTSSGFSASQMKANGLYVTDSTKKLVEYEEDCFGCLRAKLKRVQTTLSPSPRFLSREDRSLFSFSAANILFLPPITPKKNTRLPAKRQTPSYDLFLQCLIMKYAAYTP